MTGQAVKTRHPLDPRGLFYGWYIALAGAGSNFLILGLVVFGMGVFFEPMRTDLGWSAAALAAGQSLRSAEQGLLSPVTGYLLDRLGAKTMARIGVILLALGLALMAMVHDVWLFYLASTVVALGQSAGGGNAFGLTLMRWFNRNRGKATGLLNTGNGAGYFAVPVLTALVLGLGWRPTLLLTAGFILVCGLPLTVVLRAGPELYGLRPDGDKEVVADPSGKDPTPRRGAAPALAPTNSGMSVAEVLRTPAFYLLVLANAMGGVGVNAWVVFQIPHLLHSGFSHAAIGTFIASYGLLQISLRFNLGWLGDTIGRRRLYMISIALQATGLVIFSYVSPSHLWLLGLYGVTFGVGSAAWIVANQTITADYFGTRRYATIRGFAQVLHMPVGVAVPLLVGLAFDRMGTYHLAFLILGIISFSGILWLALIRRPLWNQLQTGSSR